MIEYFEKKKCQQGLGSIGKDCSLCLTSPSLTPFANKLLLVGILNKGWPPHIDNKKSGYNTTIRPYVLLPKYIYILKN